MKNAIKIENTPKSKIGNYKILSVKVSVL